MKSTCHNSLILHYKNGHYCSVCLKEQHITKNRTWMLYAALPMILLLSAFSLKAPTLAGEVAGTYSVYAPEKTLDDIVPSDSTVLEELVKDHCILTSVAVAQARIESANYTSHIAVSNKNLFGIKYHVCPYVTGEQNGHATFASYKDNIACYCHIQQMYLKKVNKAYAEDTQYCAKIKQMK